MRHCDGENVAVFEAINENLGDALREVADFLDNNDEAGYVNIHTAYHLDGGYNVIAYVH